MDPLIILALLVLGAFTGFAAGLLGIGGGMLMVPFMTMLLAHVGFPAEQVVKVAIATSLTTIVFTSISSVRAHHKRGAVRWDAVRGLAPGILVGSLLGAQLAGAVPGRMLGAFFGLFLGYSAAKMLWGAPPKAQGTLPSTAGLFGMGSVSSNAASRCKALWRAARPAAFPSPWLARSAISGPAVICLCQPARSATSTCRPWP
jgi:uncharacterized membrane protein YfcA